MLAYNIILDSIDVDHDYLDTVSVLRSQTKAGDLATMIFPTSYSLDWDYDYDYEETYTYVTDTSTVGEAFIVTSNDAGEGTLLMFRDSFGNTLLPLMANVFETAVFSKATPYAVQTYVEEYAPTAVVIEKVERNIADFATEAPLMETLACDLDGALDTNENGTKVDLAECETNTTYVAISGKIGNDNYSDQITAAYVRIVVGDDEKTYPAFMVSDGDDFGYICYLKKDTLAVLADGASEVAVQVVLAYGDDLALVTEATFDIAEFVE